MHIYADESTRAEGALEAFPAAARARLAAREGPVRGRAVHDERVRAALEAVQGVDTRVQGHGTVRRQSVAPGRPLPASVALAAQAR